MHAIPVGRHLVGVEWQRGETGHQLGRRAQKCGDRIAERAFELRLDGRLERSHRARRDRPVVVVRHLEEDIAAGDIRFDTLQPECGHVRAEVGHARDVRPH